MPHGGLINILTVDAAIRDNEEGENLFIRADKALYKAKESGRNNCQPAI